MNWIKILLVAFLINGGLTFAQIGIQTNTPDASSALDIVSTNKGILIPRVTLTNSLANPSPVTSPATGLLVFNSGANQAVGLYYWSGAAWVYVSGGTPSGNFWSLTGNSGTTPGTNFVGTTDNVDLTFNTNSAERMRIEQDGQVVVNATASLDPADVFTVSGTSGQSGINAYGSTIGLYSDAGTYGLMSFVNNSSGLPVYGKNYNVDGTGALLVGSNLNGTVFATPFSAGSVSWGNQGVIANGKHATGNGILAAGSLSSSIIYINPGTGGTLIGYHGVYGKGLNATDGTGIIGVGNNLSSYSTLTTGSGGSFFGYHGVFGKASNNSGIGIIGLGNNLSTYQIMPVGSGGAFTGYHGVFGSATNAASGVGVIGIGNNGSTAYYATNGSGGSFAGFNGSISTAVDATGIGVIGVGNNAVTYGVLSSGSGGAFTGTHGVYGLGNNSSNGVGVVGCGNNAGYSLPASGSGGYFNGYHGTVSTGNNAANGVGIVASGNNIAYAIPAGGGGGVFYGSGTGSFSKATSSSGNGIIGVGNNIATATTYTGGSGGSFTGTICGAAGYANTAGATSYGVYGAYSGGGNNHGVGVYGFSRPANNYGYGVTGYGNKYGVLGIEGTTGATNYGLYATGDVGASGTKTFMIDHPMDPENKYLKHYSIESPEVINMYRGNVILNTDGEAQISLPDYFMVININFSYDLTPIGQKAPDLYIKQEIDSNGEFIIAGGNPNQKISWVVYAERNDPYMQTQGARDVVIEKSAEEKGKYLMPELYDQPKEKGLFYFLESDELELSKSTNTELDQNQQPISLTEQSNVQTMQKVSTLSSNPVISQDHELKPVENQAELKKK